MSHLSYLNQLETTNSERIEALEALSWSWDLNLDLLSDFASYLVAYRLNEGQRIFQEGDTSAFMVFLIHGKVEIRKKRSDNEEILVIRLNEGKVFGEMPLLDGQSRSASAIVIQDSLVYLLTKEAFLLMKRQHPRLALAITFKLAKILSTRLRKTTGEWAGLIR